MPNPFQEQHGMSRTPTYNSWSAMKQRCLDQNMPDYHNYGGRGIEVCDEWKDSFIAFYEDMGERPENTSLVRHDNNGNYEPSNCFWGDNVKRTLSRRATKLNLEDVRNIKRLLREGDLTQKEIAQMYSVTSGCIYDIKTGRIWAHVE